jgi:hypothetical protein
LRFDAFESAVGGFLVGLWSGAELMRVEMTLACIDIDVQESDAYLPLLLGQGSVDD